MFRLFRDLERGEFLVVFVDTAQGGEDSNFGQFYSKTRGDFPLVMQKQCMATETVPHVRAALRWIYTQTNVKPVVAYERNNGGGSAMLDLSNSNIEGEFICYYMWDFEKGERTDKLGFDTNAFTRPKMLGEYSVVFNNKLIRHYDKTTIEQHQTFVVNKNGKPEAAANCHDDAVIAAAGAILVAKTENPTVTYEEEREESPYSFALN